MKCAACMDMHMDMTAWDYTSLLNHHQTDGRGIAAFYWLFNAIMVS